MFEEGNLLFFRPFLFKNGAEPQDKFFLVLKKMESDILLASLPTSKDHVPSDLEVKYGCLNIPMQHIRPVDYQYFINKMVEKSVLHFFSSLNEYKISAFFGIMKASEKLCAKSFLRG